MEKPEETIEELIEKMDSSSSFKLSIQAGQSGITAD